MSNNEKVVPEILTREEAIFVALAWAEAMEFDCLDRGDAEAGDDWRVMFDKIQAIKRATDTLLPAEAERRSVGSES